MADLEADQQNQFRPSLRYKAGMRRGDIHRPGSRERARYERAKWNDKRRKGRDIGRGVLLPRTKVTFGFPPCRLRSKAEWSPTRLVKTSLSETNGRSMEEKNNSTLTPLRLFSIEHFLISWGNSSIPGSRTDLCTPYFVISLFKPST